MKNIKRKLQSSSGVTIVLALAVFLIAAIFALTMVTGALSAVQNAGRQQQEEQQILSASSAAGLLSGLLTDSGTAAAPVNAIRRVTVTVPTLAGDWTDPSNTAPGAAEVRDRLLNASTGVLVKDYGLTGEGYVLLSGGTGAVYNPDSPPADSSKGVLWVAAGFLSGAFTGPQTVKLHAPDHMDDVTAELSLSGSTLTAVLTTKRESLSDHLMTLTFTREATTSKRTVSVKYEEDHGYKDPVTEDWISMPVTCYHTVQITLTTYRLLPATAWHGDSRTTEEGGDTP